MIPVDSDYTTTCQHATAVTPHATNEVASFIPKRLFVGGAGNIACRLYGDTADVTITGVPAGAQLPIRVRYIRVTGTTATNMVVFG